MSSMVLNWGKERYFVIYTERFFFYFDKIDDNRITSDIMKMFDFSMFFFRVFACCLNTLSSFFFGIKHDNKIHCIDYTRGRLKDIWGNFISISISHSVLNQFIFNFFSGNYRNN